MLTKLKSSLFIKLLAIFALTAIFLIVLMGFGFKWLIKPDDIFHQQVIGNISKYAHYLVQEIGDPPNQSNIDKISQETGLQIRVQQGENIWRSNNYSQSNAVHFHFHHIEDKDISVDHRRHSSAIKLIDRQREFLFIISHHRFENDWLIALLIISLTIFSVIGISYLLVRRLFKPIEELNKGFAIAARGELNKKIIPLSNDELGKLTIAFNNMTEDLDTLIKSKEQLLRDISHELRSPLTRIKVAADMLEPGKLTDGIKQETTLLNELIEEILEASRPQNEQKELKRETVDIFKLVENICDNYKDSQPGIKLDSTLSTMTLNADIKKIHIAIGNIIDNAVKYSAFQDQAVEVTLSNDDENIFISVLDHGKGIKNEDQHRIFQAFTRLDPSRNHAIPGFGLGLNIANNIVHQHGGVIEVESNAENYTRFVVSLPIR